LEECGPCPVFAGFTLAFALQLRKKHGKTLVRVAEEGKLEVQTGSLLTSAPGRSDWATSRLTPGNRGHQRVCLHVTPELSRPEAWEQYPLLQPGCLKCDWRKECEKE